MKKLLTIAIALVMVCSAVFALVACNSTSKTAETVAEASKMTLEELKAASKAEMEASNDTFKVIGLTSVLAKTLTAFQKEYPWVTPDNSYCKNDYKDNDLLTALQTAKKSYVADYALVQDVRSMANLDGIMIHNYVPSDYKDMGLSDKDIYPLKGIYFNKLFWTNSNFENVTGKKLYNIWQLAGTSADPDHLDKVSFQPATTEQINMSFLLSAEAPENQKRIEDAYEHYYGKKWSKEGTDYTNAGQQWVTEFVKNVSRWHSSDGTAMKETQLKDDWKAGYVYYGAFAKMKDAVGKYYTIADQDKDPILKDLLKEYTEKDKDGKETTKTGINAMDTVKWDWEIDGFNGFMYAMCSQIVNNAKHPYTACLYARFLVTLTAYSGSIYNNSLPAQDGSVGTTKVNQYGYYFPGSNDIVYAMNDWTRDVHIAAELMEDYSYLKTVKTAEVNRIKALIGQN